MLTTKTLSKQDPNYFHAMLCAIKDHFLHGRSIQSCSRMNGIKRTTLEIHVKKIKNQFNDIFSIADDILLKSIEFNSKRMPKSTVFFLPVCSQTSLFLFMTGFFTQISIHSMLGVFFKSGTTTG